MECDSHNAYFLVTNLWISARALVSIPSPMKCNVMCTRVTLFCSECKGPCLVNQQMAIGAHIQHNPSGSTWQARPCKQPSLVQTDVSSLLGQHSAIRILQPDFYWESPSPSPVHRPSLLQAGGDATVLSSIARLPKRHQLIMGPKPKSAWRCFDSQRPNINPSQISQAACLLSPSRKKTMSPASRDVRSVSRKPDTVFERKPRRLRLPFDSLPYLSWTAAIIKKIS